MDRKTGSTASYASLGPDAKMVRVPAWARAVLPETGARRYLTPLASAASATRAEAAGETVDMSMKMVPALAAAITSEATDSKTESSEIIEMITSLAPASSPMLPATEAPASAHSLVLDAVRFHTATG
jgi:hypothetical protein